MPETKKLNPYVGLPASAYWKTGVAETSPLEISGLYTPRYKISGEVTISAAGSCFAQHIGKQFKVRGYKFLDLEPAPPHLKTELRHQFGFDLYSARYGNVYSIRQLLQLFKRANGSFTPKDNIWEMDGRFYDPFRPTVEPQGFSSKVELEKDREYHLSCVDGMLQKTELFVFTFGLTEAWVDVEDGTVFPTCPGTIAGVFDPSRYQFKNFSFSETLADAEEFIAYAKNINPEVKFLFTVSPVPLTATASGQHVLQASVYSKSVLRAVVGDLYNRYTEVDYFPSYELVAAHPSRSMFFQPNLRTVASKGVEHVMNTFFSEHPLTQKGKSKSNIKPEIDEDDIICEEAILEAFQ